MGKKTGIWAYAQGNSPSADSIQINFDRQEIIVTVPHGNFQVSVVGNYCFYGGTKMTALELAETLEKAQVYCYEVNKWYF